MRSQIMLNYNADLETVDVSIDFTEETEVFAMMGTLMIQVIEQSIMTAPELQRVLSVAKEECEHGLVFVRNGEKLEYSFRE